MVQFPLFVGSLLFLAQMLEKWWEFQLQVGQFGALATRQEKFMYAHGAGEVGEVILGESGAQAATTWVVENVLR